MAKKVSIVSLGCPKNLVDSESILGRLIAQGWEFDPSVEGADLVVLNTCGFIESARQEATETLESLLKLKRRKKIGAIAVCGCLIRALGNELPRRYPEVDAWYGPFDESRLSETFPLGPLVPPKPERAEPARKPVPFRDTVRRRYTFRDENRLLLTLPHTAYLKIAEGCDRFCSYCAIPAIRGRFTSKPLEAVLSEAEILARSGVKELVLIAQETTFWGNDLYGEPRLAKLLTELKGMNAFPWIRLLYTYPLFFGDELLELFGGGDGDASAVLPYVDLPLQHCNDAILKRMNRRVGKSETEDLLARLRETIPGLTLRTTFITGLRRHYKDFLAGLRIILGPETCAQIVPRDNLHSIALEKTDQLVRRITTVPNQILAGQSVPFGKLLLVAHKPALFVDKQVVGIEELAVRLHNVRRLHREHLFDGGLDVVEINLSYKRHVEVFEIRGGHHRTTTFFQIARDVAHDGLVVAIVGKRPDDVVEAQYQVKAGIATPCAAIAGRNTIGHFNVGCKVNACHI